MYCTLNVSYQLGTFHSDTYSILYPIHLRCATVSTCCAAPSKLAALLAHRRVLEHQTPQGRRCVLAHGWAGHGVCKQTWWVLSMRRRRGQMSVRGREGGMET